MKNIKNVLPGLITAAALVTAVTWLPAAQAQATAEKATAPQAKQATGLSDSCLIKGENWRGKPFYEILFMNRDAKGAGGIGNYFNSIGQTYDVSNEVIDARFRALSAETLKEEHGSDGVFFNGPRRWVANGYIVEAHNGCKETVIGTIPFRVLGTFQVPSFDGFISGPPVAYKVLVSKRTSSMSFNAGEQVYELVTPEGAVYTMFSLSLKIDPNNTIENLPTLGERLTLPEGWTYRVRTLKEDLVLSASYDTDPPNTVVLDQFEGNYQYNPGAK